MTALDLRPLSMGEILDRTFSLYRRHFLLFIGISALPHVLTLTFGLLQVLVLQDPVVVTRAGRPATVLLPRYGTTVSVVTTLLSLLVAGLVYVLSQGGTIAAVSELYLGRTTSIAASLRRVWDDIGTLFAVIVLNSLATVGAGLLLVIPGIYVGCRLLVCLPSAIVEGCGPRESLSRSWNLSKGFAFRAFLLGLLYLVIALSAGMLIGVLLVYGIQSAANHGAALRAWLAAQQVLSSLIDILIVPIMLIGTAILYFDLRVRKEAFDLQFMMDPTSERRGAAGSVPSIL